VLQKTSPEIPLTLPSSASGGKRDGVRGKVTEGEMLQLGLKRISLNEHKAARKLTRKILHLLSFFS